MFFFRISVFIENLQVVQTVFIYPHSQFFFFPSVITQTEFKIFFLIIYLGDWVFVACVQAFSSCGKWGLLSSHGEQASHCSDFSCSRAWALGHMGFSKCGAQT